MPDDLFAHLLLSWPDFAQMDRLSVGVTANRFLLEIDIDRPRKGVGDNQRWRGEVVGSNVGIHSAFEVTVAGQDGRSHQVVLMNGR